MTKPYSEDLRIRAVEAVANGMSRRQVAKLFKVGASSVIRWTDQHERTGRVAAKPMGGSRGTSIEGADRMWLLRRIEAQSDLTLEEMRREGIDVEDPVAYCRAWFTYFLLPAQMGEPSAILSP